MNFRAALNAGNFLTGSSSQEELCSMDLIKGSKVISNGCYSVITCRTDVYKNQKDAQNSCN